MIGEKLAMLETQLIATGCFAVMGASHCDGPTAAHALGAVADGIAQKFLERAGGEMTVEVWVLALSAAAEAATDLMAGTVQCEPCVAVGDPPFSHRLPRVEFVKRSRCPRRLWHAH